MLELLALILVGGCFAPLILFFGLLKLGDAIVEGREWDKVEYFADGTIRRAEKRRRK